MFDDDILGRARVAESSELNEFYARLEKLGAGALWTVANEIEPWEPAPKSIPMHWSYEEIRPLVVESASLVRGDDAGRRVVMLVNDGRREDSAVVGHLYTGIQIMNPMESMTAHRHAASALRFVIEGEGAWTIVDGDKLRVKANDFAITPKGTWHEHGNESEESFVIWQDGLDIPLVNTLDANFYEVHPDTYQAKPMHINAQYKEYGSGIMGPDSRRGWSKMYSPLNAYPWERTYEALENLASAHEMNPWDGFKLDYINPATGGSVMPTMGAAMQMLPGGVHTKAQRHTGSAVYHVAKGTGYSVINGKRFDWKEHDVFVVPSWAWYEHVNTSESDDACLFNFNDQPVIRSLDLWAHQAMDDNDGHQVIGDAPAS
ncbi:cupin domain-containing protein [Enemella sp. A6]|uniref:cupin domain-containing protein n=1 Tax=Enemella sp. A6 TaxID=3440152 RepID=UPI003EBD030B